MQHQFGFLSRTRAEYLATGIEQQKVAATAPSPAPTPAPVLVEEPIVTAPPLEMVVPGAGPGPGPEMTAPLYATPGAGAGAGINWGLWLLLGGVAVGAFFLLRRRRAA